MVIWRDERDRAQDTSFGSSALPITLGPKRERDSTSRRQTEDARSRAVMKRASRSIRRRPIGLVGMPTA